jgi:hypothetical protein
MVRVGAVYLVVAHRWGWSNTHSYYVYAGPDRTKACALAQAECDDRGGKYGCVVWEFDADGVDYKRIAYFESSMDTSVTDGPHHNHRIDYFERLGQFVDEAASGHALLPKPDDPKYLSYQPVEPLPKFLLDEVERKKAFAISMQELDDKRRATKTNAPQAS